MSQAWDHLYIIHNQYTSSYVGLVLVCHVGSKKSLMSYGKPEYQNTQGRTAHKLLTGNAQCPHK